jgi:hypothetical protein
MSDMLNDLPSENSEETKKKLSDSHKGRKKSAAHRKALSEAAKKKIGRASCRERVSVTV